MVSGTGSDVAAADTRTLAATLAPLLRHACGDRLGDITWFKADWQRGGAATGTSVFRGEGQSTPPVVIKLPVGQRELWWTRQLQDAEDDDPVVPRLYASGEVLGGYDLGWMVMERFGHGPLGLKWHTDHVRRIAEAIARFHEATRALETEIRPPVEEPWQDMLREAAESIRTNNVADEGRWLGALKQVRGRLDELVQAWNERPADDWLHGDPHIANAMSRHAMNAGTVSLIDLAEIHRGHWIEDGVYLERQLWARPERMKPVKPVKALADARRRLDLPVETDYPRLAMIRRGLLAATAPRFMKSEGHPAYLAACLQWLETALQDL